MKAATVIILVGFFVGCVVCDPVPNDEKQQTAEAEYYPGPGRSRDRDDYDGEYRRLDGDYGRHYHGDDDGYRHDEGYWHHDSYYPKHHYPARPKTCVCSRNLDVTPLSSQNNCLAASCNLANLGSYCTESTSPTAIGSALLCPCAIVGKFGAGTRFGTCYGIHAAGGGGLCYQATCPSAGSINLRGQAVPLDCQCGLLDMLFIYKDAPFVAGNELVTNQQNGDFTVQCTAGQNFYFCENAGIVISSSLKAAFTVQSTGACAAGFTTVTCKP